MTGHDNPAMGGAAVLPGLGEWRRFPGASDEVAKVRHWLAGLLPTCEARDDVLMVGSELATNALRYTASGAPGGHFAVKAEWTADGMLLVCVADLGGPTVPRVIEDPREGMTGRGLFLVRGLSADWGFAGDTTGRRVWAAVAWAASDGPAGRQGSEQR